MKLWKQEIILLIAMMTILIHVPTVSGDLVSNSTANATSTGRNATVITSPAALGSPFIFNGKFASSPADDQSPQNYDHYVSFTMQANSLAPNYAYDLVNRGALSDGSLWVYNLYMFGTDSSGLNGRVAMYNTKGMTQISPMSSPLSPGTNYTIVWEYTNNGGGELFINGVSQGSATGGGPLENSLSSAFNVGLDMYNGGGRQHSPFYGTITNVYHYERDLIPLVNFNGTPTSGPAPLMVQFNDTSTGSPTLWSWVFGDGGTSTVQNPSYTYTTPGTYNVSLTATNVDGSNTTVKAGYVNVTISPPIANFTATPLSGTAPMTVQFNDTSTGSPTAWNWSFGDGGISSVQNPSYIYTTPGTYTVSLTATNAAGSNTTTHQGYVTVTSGTVTYSVFSDGVSLYHNFENNTDIPGANTTSTDFYNGMINNPCNVDPMGITYCWNGEGSNPVDDSTGSKYWSQTESANSDGANSAEFAFHVGHGWDGGILFGTANSNYQVFRSNMSFSTAKWVVFDSCNVLNESIWKNWESVFNGVHIILGFDTEGLVGGNEGSEFVARMKGGMYDGTQEPVSKIRDAWEMTLKNTVNDSTLNGAYMWADPSEDDYLPGYGKFVEPTNNNGQYAVNWTNFPCAGD
jgi:PKD repeat protein